MPRRARFSLCQIAASFVLAVIVIHAWRAVVRTKRMCNYADTRILVGVFTGPTIQHKDRRDALLSTWFPNSTEALREVECRLGITVRFVVTGSKYATPDENMLLVMDVPDTYSNLPVKVSRYFYAAMRMAKYEYVVKMDDDVYLSLPNLRQAAEQWRVMEVGYAGCMTLGSPVFTNVSSKWFDPMHDHFAGKMHMYACGPMYALSGLAISKIFRDGPREHRLLANEDQSVALWMLAHTGISFFDDRRLCTNTCHASHAFVGVNDNAGAYCMGMPNPIAGLINLHAMPGCRAEPQKVLPFIPSQYERFNIMMRHFFQRHATLI
jgi:hypothetical protein